MKRYDDDFAYDFKKKETQNKKREHKAGGFRCSHCRRFVVINDAMGTAHRNHCNLCMWSKHVDETKGDRRAICNGGMEPIGLTFRREGTARTGEIMLIHQCVACQKMSINRIARDDIEQQILTVFGRSLVLDNALRARLASQCIHVAGLPDKTGVLRQLFGDAF